KTLLADIARVCEKRGFARSEVCVAEGSKAIYFYMLLKGKMALERKLPESWFVAHGGRHDATVHVLQEKDVIGWSSLVPPGVHTATARCLDDCEVVEVEGKKLIEILDANPEAAYPLMKKLAGVIAMRLVDTSNRLIREMSDFALYRSM
ncbi:MAG: cyclic nucleotide-binding domain-containing protein, partial [Chloroflexi bacterium]|nr:cyclic nucleotide-binding domain-containing protein [Chloroflexota bacterium]